MVLHSLQTLIHRTASVHGSSSGSFTEECIASARKALACHHQASRVMLDNTQSGLLTSYMGWFIFLRPFTPFIVLFCHVVETGDQGDLRRMHEFAESMRSLAMDSDIGRKHQRLFQVFHDVALRYNELKTASEPASCDEGAQLEVNDEIDDCLNAMGLCSHLGNGIEIPSSAAGAGIGAMGALPNDLQSISPYADGNAVARGYHLAEPELAPHLPYWFQVSQQMMGG